MTYLLDTSALLAHYRSEAGAELVQEIFDRDDAVILLCSVSLVEMVRRLRHLGVPDTEAWETVENYRLMVSEIVAVDVAVAQEGDRLQKASSDRLPLVDSLIAGAASIRKAVLVSRDQHMRQIPADHLSQLDLQTPPTR